MSTPAQSSSVGTTPVKRNPPSDSVPQATRISERQAARLQAKSKPKTPRLHGGMAKWVIGGTRSDERQWIEKIVVYLHTDQTQENNPRILRVLLKEWPILRTTLHTVATMEKVKIALVVENGVPYLRQLQSEDPRSTRARKWEY